MYKKIYMGILRLLEVAFIIAVMSVCFAGFIDANASTLVIGQSNALGVVRHGNINDDIVDCTHSGKPLKTFMPSWDSNSYYFKCIEKTKGKNITGIILWQGESDTYRYADAMAWTARARSLLLNLRGDLGRRLTPIVIVTLNDLPHPNRAYWDLLRSSQERIVAKNLSIVSSSGYQTKLDNVHYTDAGYVAISTKIMAVLSSMSQ